MANHNILSNCTSGGCGSKISATELNKILSQITQKTDPNLLVGYDSSDDAAVYKINESTSIVSTLDFFPPMINDPKIFGAIVAANALSDIYAMGASPVIALNIVCFPKDLELSILEEILDGGTEKIKEAGASIAGGHSIYDNEIKYGLSVTGLIPNNRIIRNNTPKVGDKLILTKPLGVGIVMAGNRADLISNEELSKTADQMMQLNKYACESMMKYDVNACTDITGFGLLNHAMEMITNTAFSIKFYIDKIPYIKLAYKLAGEYILTGAGQKNRKFLKDSIDISNVQFELQELLFDPQTSGGLLISVSEKDAMNLLNEIRVTYPEASVIGEISLCKDSKMIFQK